MRNNQDLKAAISLRPGLANPIIQKLGQLTASIQAVRVANPNEIQEELHSSDVYVTTRCTEDDFRAGGGRIKLVQMFGVGVNNIDLAAATKYHAMVAVTPVNHVAVAEHAIALLLTLAKRIIRSDQSLRKGSWAEGFGRGNPSSSLRGKTLGIIGFGRIAQEIARMARGLGMHVMATRQRPQPHPYVQILAPDHLKDLLSSSDFVIVACPLTKTTERLIGREEFGMMKPTAFLINIARGKVIEEDALYEALRDKQIAGAGIDTWYLYPREDPLGPQLPSNRNFHQLENVVMTPHRAAYDRETFDATVDFIVRNIERLALGKHPLGLVQF